jgi:SpoVK/Ycf46/Vps4 family AAA+-type ATPase
MIDFENPSGELRPVNGNTLTEVELLPQLQDIKELITRTSEFFFKGNYRLDNVPFKGFILQGPPGTGKTEVVKQATRALDRRLKNVHYQRIDGGTIASPKWGDAEKKLQKVFLLNYELKKEKGDDSKLVLLFDDIESFMLGRGAELAKEWHYSINSIFFHGIDDLDPSNTIVCATTNKPELVDDAIRSRLHVIEFPTLPLDELLKASSQILEATNTSSKDKEEILNIVREKLKNSKSPTIRDARTMIVVECIRNRVWSV